MEHVASRTRVIDPGATGGWVGDGGGGGLVGGGGEISAGAGVSSTTPPASKPPITTNVRIVAVVPANPTGINAVTVFVIVVPNEVSAPSAPVVAGR